MSNLTRRFKKNKKNKTMKKGGAYEEREGIIEILGNKMKGVASSAASTLANTALRFAGLERIKDPSQYREQEQDVEQITESTSTPQQVVSRKSTSTPATEETYDDDSSFGCKVLDIMDRTGGVIFNDINDLLGSDELKQTTKQAAEQTAAIIKDTAKTFNDALNDPDVRVQVEEAIKKAGEISDMVVKYGEKPYYRAVNVAAKAAQKATSAAVTGAIKVGTDGLSAVPFLGSVVSVGNMVNNTSKAACAISEAGSDVVQAASDAIIETNKSVRKELGELEEKKKMGEQISNRINNSINNFENPIITQTAGGHRTRRRLFKHIAKTKRIRLTI
jgi:hypothetical protein